MSRISSMALWFALSLLVGCAHAGGRPLESGATLEALSESGYPVTFRIDRVQPDPADPEGEVFLYVVSVLDPTDRVWKPYCQPDLEGEMTAIPLQGSWDARGSYTASDSLITFACTRGVIAKCVRWGFKPWKSRDGQSLRDYHRACTRMAMADYCGTGTPHTRDGTRIDVYDQLGIQKQVPDSHLVFEAAWSPEGATYVNRARYAQPLEELFAECPEKLKGRTALDTPGLTREEILARWPETLMFNDSALQTARP